jgi:hypothetical protein
MNRFCSIFSQLLKLFPRLEFEALVKQHRGEYHARGFTCWQQFVAMLFCQLGRAQSLREICGGLASCEGKLVHLGMAGAPPKSTLAYANANRPWQLYRSIFNALLARCQQEVARHGRKFRFKNKLLSIDATTIELCATLFDWAKFRRTKGAVKLHMVLDHDGYLPSVAVITDGKHADVRVARRLRFASGTILVMDRGYLDFAWFAQLMAQGVFFVTRPKHNTAYTVVESRSVVERSLVVADEIIALSGFQARRDCSQLLRRIEVVVPETGEVLTLLTNHLTFAATTVAAIYKERWQIELLFKALKQNLRIKTFVGTSPNALYIQIWTALIALLILRYLQIRARFGWSLSNLTALLRMNLFVHRDLWRWLDAPFESPPNIPQPLQTAFAFA